MSGTSSSKRSGPEITVKCCENDCCFEDRVALGNVSTLVVNTEEAFMKSKMSGKRCDRAVVKELEGAYKAILIELKRVSRKYVEDELERYLRESQRSSNACEKIRNFVKEKFIEKGKGFQVIYKFRNCKELIKQKYEVFLKQLDKNESAEIEYHLYLPRETVEFLKEKERKFGCKIIEPMDLFTLLESSEDFVLEVDVEDMKIQIKSCKEP